MSFTKVSVAGIGTTGTITLTNVSVAGVITATDATFSGNVSVGGTLTYEDVTNVDSVGLVTARSGILVTGGGGINLSGGAGVVTATTYRVGTAATLDASGLSVSAGVVTATTYRVGTATTLDASGLSVSAGVVTTTTLRIGGGSAAAPSITPTGDTDTGIFFPSADTIAFGEGGSEAARIDSSGRFGIGTTSPSYTCDVNGGLRIDGSNLELGLNSRYDLNINTGTDTASATNIIIRVDDVEAARIDSSRRLLVGTSSAIYTNDTIQIAGSTYNPLGIYQYSASAGVGAQINLARSKSGTVGTNTIVASGDRMGNIDFRGADGASDYVVGARIAAEVDGTPGANDMPGRLVFLTTADGASSPTERMRITSAGNVRLNQTLHFDGGGSGCGDINFNNGSQTNFYSIRTNTTDFYISDTDFSNYARLVGQTFTAWTFASDARIKENIVDCEYGIETIKRIKARRFNFVNSDQSVIGFIAQELKDVIPEAVIGNEVPFAETDTPAERAAKTMGVSKDSIFPVLVTSLQQAIERIEALEAKVAALKAQ